jgi:hypothetical protein
MVGIDFEFQLCAFVLTSSEKNLQEQNQLPLI